MTEQYFEHNGREYTATKDGRILYGLIEVSDPRSDKKKLSCGGDQVVIKLDDYRLKK